MTWHSLFLFVLKDKRDFLATNKATSLTKCRTCMKSFFKTRRDTHQQRAGAGTSWCSWWSAAGTCAQWTAARAAPTAALWAGTWGALPAWGSPGGALPRRWRSALIGKQKHQCIHYNVHWSSKSKTTFRWKPFSGLEKRIRVKQV